MSESAPAAAAPEVPSPAHAEEPPAAPLADMKADWHALAWRPAGSKSLAESWLSAGAPFRGKRRRR